MAVGWAATGAGYTQAGPDGRRAAVWISRDGINWSRVPHDEEAFGMGSPAMSSVTNGGPGLVAIGADPAGSPVWTSTDGTTWWRVRHDISVFAWQFANAVIETPGDGHLRKALVAVGGTGAWSSPFQQRSTAGSPTPQFDVEFSPACSSSA